LLSKSKGIQAGDGPIKQAILKHKTRLNAEFIKVKVRRGVTRNEELAIAHEVTATITTTEGTKNGTNIQTKTGEGTGVSNNPRRWVRVNSLKTTLEEVVDFLRQEGFTELESPSPLLQ
jgi:16S rRNA C967 or C1407 C5-methylase (RsmB/RsmF family)